MSIHGANQSTSSPRAGSPGAVGRATLPATPLQTDAGVPAVSVRGLSRTYQAGVPGCSARVQAIRDVDLEVDNGAVLGILGPAGSGKSTLLLCLAGLLKPDAGSVAWFGRVADDGGRPPGIAYVPERSAHYPFMTVREAIEYHALVRNGAGRPSPADIERAIAAAGLVDVASRRIGSLPWDARPQVSIAQALSCAPRLLLVDETLDAVNPRERRDITRTLRELAASGSSVVVASDSVTVLRALTDRVAVMGAGRLSAPVDTTTLDHAPMLELTVAAPAVARRLPGSRVAEDAWGREVLRVPMEGTTAEAILSRCQSCGLRVESSRVVIDRAGD